MEWCKGLKDPDDVSACLDSTTRDKNTYDANKNDLRVQRVPPYLKDKLQYEIHF